MKRLLPFLIISIFITGSIIADTKNRDLRQALRKLVEQADSGVPKAMFELARLHDSGYDSISVDSARSTALYLLAAQKGYAPAANYIGFRYYKGEIVSKDLDSAVYWISQAAENGDITAASNLGYLMLDAPDFPHDEEKALFWLQKAAEAGIEEPQLRIVELRSQEWEHLPPDSALRLGEEYYLGYAPIMGTSLLEIAAKSNLPKALALLGDAYSKGRGVVYDHFKSIEYFFQAAVDGEPASQFVIAELLEIFPDALENVPLKKEQSEETPDFFYDPNYWYEKAAEAGITDSESAFSHLLSPKNL